MGPQGTSEHPQTATERYSIAIITLEEPMFREMRRALSPSFRTTMASTESQIKTLIDDPDIHGIVLDLECIGEGAADGVDGQEATTSLLNPSRRRRVWCRLAAVACDARSPGARWSE